MIKNFTKDTGEGYLNILQLAWLFLLSELHDYLVMFGAYDISTQTYNKRRVFWVVFFTVLFTVVVSTFLFTSLVYVGNTFGFIGV